MNILKIPVVRMRRLHQMCLLCLYWSSFWFRYNTTVLPWKQHKQDDTIQRSGNHCLGGLAIATCCHHLFFSSPFSYYWRPLNFIMLLSNINSTVYSIREYPLRLFHISSLGDRKHMSNFGIFMNWSFDAFAFHLIYNFITEKLIVSVDAFLFVYTLFVSDEYGSW